MVSTNLAALFDQEEGLEEGVVVGGGGGGGGRWCGGKSKLGVSRGGGID